MPANVETMFYTREKPWHGLGIRVESALNSQEALVAAGLDWKVIQKPITTSDGCLIPGFKANIRDRDQQIAYCEAKRPSLRSKTAAFRF